MANIPISALPSVDPTGYTNQDLLVLVNYQLPSGTTSNTPLSALTSYVLSAFTGNTSATCISDLYVTNLYGCSPITIYDSIQSNGSQSTGTTSFAFGNNVSAFGNYSHAEGASTISSGTNSHAEGSSTQSIGGNSHAEGRGTQSIGDYSHSEGFGTQSIGEGSHAEGRQTTSTGLYSHAEGFGTLSIGNSSHAEGRGTIASGSYQHVSGQFNESGNTTSGAFIIGNGSNNLSRSNLLFAGGNQVNISGKTITTNFQMTSGATNGYILTSDSLGNGSWQSITASGGLVTGLTFNNGTYDLTVNTNAGDFTQSLYILAGDMTVTGGTYNPGTGTATFTTNSGGTFNVTGFLTGYTDTNIYTVDGSLTGNRTVNLSGYSLNFTEDININGISYGKGQGGPPNIAIGDNTLINNSSGFYNVAIGRDCLQNNTIGISNVSIGYQSLRDNDGDLNVAIGNDTMVNNTTGGSNVAIGTNALTSNTIGSNNISIGTDSLAGNDNGDSNVSIGLYSSYNNVSGSFNTSLGRESLYSNLGSYNTAIGYNSLASNTLGINNTSVGSIAGISSQIGDNNTYVGYSTGGGISSGSNNTIIGANVSGLSSSLSNNIIIADGQGNRRINVDNNGNVGIGTNSPSYLLNVSGITNITYGLIVGNELGTYVQTGNHKMQVVATGTTTPIMIQGGSGAVEVWQDSTPTTAVSFGMAVPGSGITNDFLFSTYNGSWSEKLRISNSGNVGIGVSSPSDKLEVSGKTKTTNFQITSGATNGYVLTSDASGNASWQSPSGLSEYTLTFMGTSLNPGDGVTYYVGATANAPFTTDTNVQHIVPKTGTITKVAITSRQTAGSSQTSTFSVGINGVYTQISNAVLFNAIRTNSLSTGLNIPVSQGDLLTIRWLCPTWTPTNPTGVILNVTLFIQ